MLAIANGSTVKLFSLNGGSWTEAQKVTVPLRSNYRIRRLAINDGGTTLLVSTGTPDLHLNTAVFSNNGGKWTSSKILQQSSNQQDIFGSPLALSGDGSSALIGPYYLADKSRGIDLFVPTNSGWVLQQALPVDNPSGVGGAVSAALSADGAVALVSYQNTRDDLQGVVNIYTGAVPAPFPTSAAASCFSTTPSRLTVGQSAHITAGSSNNMRDIPSHDGKLITKIPGGATVDVVAGPVCDAQFVWWQVSYKRQTGWTPESDGQTYFIVPK